MRSHALTRASPRSICDGRLDDQTFRILAVADGHTKVCVLIAGDPPVHGGKVPGTGLEASCFWGCARASRNRDCALSPLSPPPAVRAGTSTACSSPSSPGRCGSLSVPALSLLFIRSSGSLFAPFAGHGALGRPRSLRHRREDRANLQEDVPGLHPPRASRHHAAGRQAQALGKRGRPGGGAPGAPCTRPTSPLHLNAPQCKTHSSTPAGDAAQNPSSLRRGCGRALGQVWEPAPPHGRQRGPARGGRARQAQTGQVPRGAHCAGAGVINARGCERCKL